ncbi:hypothetical protein [Tenacibaculum piscium]|nr:hypothetical protein [Tenacibaculum piscium]
MNKFQKNLTSLEVVVILLLFTLSISIFSMNVSSRYTQVFSTC